MAREYSENAEAIEGEVKAIFLRAFGISGEEVDAVALRFKNLVDDIEDIKANLGVNNT